MNQSDSACPVCLRQDVKLTRIESAVPQSSGVELENRTHADSAVLVTCPACGEFVVSECDRVNLQSERLRNRWSAAQLSALLREQTIRSSLLFWLQYGMEPYGPLEWDGVLAPIDLDELLARWPRTVPDRIDRTLCNLARLSPTGGHRLKLSNEDYTVAFADTRGEAYYHIKTLMERNLVQGLFGSGGLVSELTLTLDGWARFEELTRGANSPENPVFVAMWFGDTDQKARMDEAFYKAIHPAIERAGFLATRADLVEHNDWIMDKILGDIRLAPFVVADFTGHRNGVYFEAGFARGLGIPVIHTCEAGDFGKAHFDTGQLNHVLWRTSEELRKKLYHRIIASIGQGPHLRDRQVPNHAGDSE